MNLTRTLFVNGIVHTPADPGATALLAEGDTIGWIGHEGAALAHSDGVDRVIDVQGALITPAFVDAHVHITTTGMHLQGLDLSQTRNANDLLDLTANFCRDQPKDQIILGHGWDETGWQDPILPNRLQLDEAAQGAALYLTRVDVHSALANTTMLDLIPDAAQLPGFTPEGLLHSDAHHAARSVVLDRIPMAQRDALVDTALAAWASAGVAAVHEMAGPETSNTTDVAHLMQRANTRPGPQVTTYWGELGGAKTALELGAVGAGGDLFADGSIGSHTANLSYPYQDRPCDSGVPYIVAAEVRDHVLECVSVGIQAGFHAIGDQALVEVVQGFVAATEVVGLDRIRIGRHRIEHVEMPTQQQITQLAAMGITASVQPIFEEMWGGPNSMYRQRLGSERSVAMNPFRAIAAAGVAMAFGSDSPVSPISPWATVRAAIQHRTPGSSLTARAAFSAHTRGGWRAISRDDSGVLHPGAPATLAVWDCEALAVQQPDERVARWSTDPRSGTPVLPVLADDISLPQANLTMSAGQIIYERT
jgi:predicted amidohydrolase YtcJ